MVIQRSSDYSTTDNGLSYIPDKTLFYGSHARLTRKLGDLDVLRFATVFTIKGQDRSCKYNHKDYGPPKAPVCVTFNTFIVRPYSARTFQSQTVSNILNSVS